MSLEVAGAGGDYDLPCKPNDYSCEDDGMVGLYSYSGEYPELCDFQLNGP